MTIFPNAKINIGLNITGKRSDGYHNIESLFYPVGIKDALEFVVQGSGIDSDELTITGLPTDCRMKDNLVVKALNLLRKDFTIPPLKIHLHKSIPSGSGLGGGSSDAAFMLRYLNRYFNLELDTGTLSELSLMLGSDCAFFIRNKPALVTGRGEIIRESSLSLNGKYLHIVHPGIHISTAEAYGMVKAAEPENNLEDLLNEPLKRWRDRISNDFQDIIIDKHPLIGEIVDTLYAAGALYSSISGSGSAVYGIFDDRPDVEGSGEYWRWTGIMQ